MPNPYTSAFKLGADTPASSNSNKGALIVSDSSSEGSAVLYVLGPTGGSTVPIIVTLVNDTSVVLPVRISGTGTLDSVAVYELF